MVVAVFNCRRWRILIVADHLSSFGVWINVGNAPVPEPITMVSAFMAIGGLGGYLRRRNQAAKA